jgi:hypothetical protein
MGEDGEQILQADSTRRRRISYSSGLNSLTGSLCEPAMRDSFWVLPGFILWLFTPDT